MRILVFGASGMVGQGVLRECLRDPGVTEVVSVSRRPLDSSVDRVIDRKHPRLRELILPEDFRNTDFRPSSDALTGFDACFFPLGISSFRTPQQAYLRVTRDLTLAAARILARQNPSMVFIYVSGEGTGLDRKAFWARVKGATENAIGAMNFRAAYMFRPGLIVPQHGVRSRVRWMNLLYGTLRPFSPLLRRLPRVATDTETLGRAMLRAARETPPGRVWNTAAINALGR